MHQVQPQQYKSVCVYMCSCGSSLCLPLFTPTPMLPPLFFNLLFIFLPSPFPFICRRKSWKLPFYVSLLTSKTLKGPWVLQRSPMLLALPHSKAGHGPSSRPQPPRGRGWRRQWNGEWVRACWKWLSGKSFNSLHTPGTSSFLLASLYCVASHLKWVQSFAKPCRRLTVNGVCACMRVLLWCACL